MHARYRRIIAVCVVLAAVGTVGRHRDADAADGLVTSQGWVYSSRPGDFLFGGHWALYANRPAAPDGSFVPVFGTGGLSFPVVPAKPFAVSMGLWLYTASGWFALGSSEVVFYVPGHPSVSGREVVSSSFTWTTFLSDLSPPTVSSVVGFRLENDGTLSISAATLVPGSSLTTSTSLEQSWEFASSVDWMKITVAVPAKKLLKTTDIHTSVTPDVTPVAIDIKPGNDANAINPASKGKVPVAVLSDAGFDAPNHVVWPLTTFGRSGDEPSLADNGCVAEDVDLDGLLDLLCFFETQLAGFQSGDEWGVLRGELVDGSKIEGSDVVRLVGGKKK